MFVIADAFKSAEKFDFRHHLAETLQLSPDTVAEICSRTPEDDSINLEVIVLRISNRPTGMICRIRTLEKHTPNRTRFRNAHPSLHLPVLRKHPPKGKGISEDVAYQKSPALASIRLCMGLAQCRYRPVVFDASLSWRRSLRRGKVGRVR